MESWHHQWEGGANSSVVIGEDPEGLSIEETGMRIKTEARWFAGFIVDLTGGTV